MIDWLLNDILWGGYGRGLMVARTIVVRVVDIIRIKIKQMGNIW